MTALSILPEPPNNRPSTQRHCAQKRRASDNLETFDWTRCWQTWKTFSEVTAPLGDPVSREGGGDIFGARKQGKLGCNHLGANLVIEEVVQSSDRPESVVTSSPDQKRSKLLDFWLRWNEIDSLLIDLSHLEISLKYCSASMVTHYIPVRCAPVLAVLAVRHAFCLRPDYRYLVCRIATYLSVFYNPIAICSKLSVYCYFVRNCLCVGILFKIALVFAAKTIMLEHCPIFVVFVVTYT